MYGWCGGRGGGLVVSQLGGPHPALIRPRTRTTTTTVLRTNESDGACPEIYGGWPMILSGLKTWLETGTVLTTPGSLMYG